MNNYPVGSKEFERWYHDTFDTSKVIHHCYKEFLLVGWNAAKERALKEVGSSVNFYSSAGYTDDPMISKTAVTERIKAL